MNAHRFLQNALLAEGGIQNGYTLFLQKPGKQPTCVTAAPCGRSFKPGTLAKYGFAAMMRARQVVAKVARRSRRSVFKGDISIPLKSQLPGYFCEDRLLKFCTVE